MRDAPHLLLAIPGHGHDEHVRSLVQLLAAELVAVTLIEEAPCVVDDTMYLTSPSTTEAIFSISNRFDYWMPPEIIFTDGWWYNPVLPRVKRKYRSRANCVPTPGRRTGRPECMLTVQRSNPRWKQTRWKAKT